MTVESVKDDIRENKYIVEFIEFEESTATVDLAAEALGTDPKNIAKSLGIRLKEEDIIILASGIKKLDNRKFKLEFKEKPRFISGEDILEATGHPVGGLTPFGLNRSLKVYIDESLRDLDIVYPAGGSPKTCLKIEMKYFADILGNNWVDVMK